MSSVAVRAVEAVVGRDRLSILSERATRLEALRDDLKERLVQVTTEVADLTLEIEKLLKVEELFRALMDHLVVNQVRTLESVVTDGLQTIFFDQDLHLESEMETKYNKVSIEFQLRQGGVEDPLVIRGRPLDSFGGGPSSVVALILRVLILLKLKKLPFLVLDETLLAVSDEYIAPTGKFLELMAKSMKLHFLLITHKTAFCDHSDVAYQSEEVVLGSQRALRVKEVSSKVVRVRP